MADGLRARPPTRDQIAQVIARDWRISQGLAEGIARDLLAEFSIVARGDLPPAPAPSSPLRDRLAQEIHEAQILGAYRRVYASDIADRLLAEFAISERGVTPDPQTADAAFDAWYRTVELTDTARRDPSVLCGMGFTAGWSARAAVGDSPPTPAGATTEPAGTLDLQGEQQQTLPAPAVPVYPQDPTQKETRSQ